MEFNTNRLLPLHRGAFQKRFWAVSADAVNDNVRRQQADAVGDERKIFLRLHDMKRFPFIKAAELCALQDVEKLELDPVNEGIV